MVRVTQQCSTTNLDDNQLHFTCFHGQPYFHMGVVAYNIMFTVLFIKSSFDTGTYMLFALLYMAFALLISMVHHLNP